MLADLFYALLLFNTLEKMYFMLPDNTKHSTQMAFMLMQRILSFLPYAIQSRTGFVTYVNKAESSVGDYVIYEIRCMFLANTEGNQNVCRNTRTAFVFCNGCETGVSVPTELQHMMNEIAESFL